MNQNYKLTSNDELTASIKNSGIATWNELIEFVKNLPYGRNANRTNLALVITEKKGSCSSKHALLKRVADLNEIENVKLILGIYRMNKQNTPNIGTVLSDSKIDFIPEAHCYLKINDERIDVTFSNSNILKIEADIIEEQEIEPEQVSEYKVQYHKTFLKRWISENQTDKGFDEIWKVREKCINNLSENDIKK